MMINICSSTSNPLPEKEDFVSPPLVDRMDPLLVKAAMEGDINYLQTLQDFSILQLKRTTFDETVLHIATQFNQVEFAKLSLQYCPPLLSLVNSSGDTALHVAAREGHTEMVEHFLSFCIDPKLTRMVNSEKDTALHCCTRRVRNECVELLVSADPEVCGFVNKAHESPLYLSIASRFLKGCTMTKFIKDSAGSCASHEGPNGLTTMHAAVLHYATKSVELLVEWKREMIREGDNLGMTPLHYAAFNGNTRAVQLFLQHDSNAIYCLNHDGQSALHVAAFFGRAKPLEELVKHRPDCYNMVDNKGRTALHAAVLGNQHGVVEFILKTPSLASLTNKVDKDGNSPLHLAAYFRSYKIIKSLRFEGAIFIINHNSYTPLDVYDNQFNKLEDLQQLGDKEFSKVIATRYHLKFESGLEAKRGYANKRLKKMNTEVVTNSTEGISLRNDQLNKSVEGKRADFGEESALEVNLLVAMLVATVTFAAGFTVPGGLLNDGEDEGLATLTNKLAFKAFVVFNTLAFCCSIYAVLVHFTTSLKYHGARVYYKEMAASFTATAIMAMVLAFCFGTHVVLTKSTALSFVPYCISGSFLLLYPISRILYMLFKIKTSEGDFDSFSLSARAKLFTKARKMQQFVANYRNSS